MSNHVHAKPDGLRIFRQRIPGQRNIAGGPAYRLIGHFRTRGRTGAATRARFAALPDFRRQQVLANWALGRVASLGFDDVGNGAR